MRTFEQFTTKDIDIFLKKLNINFNDFTLSPNQFDHRTTVHGVNHIFRVMFWAITIGRDLNDIDTTRRAFMGAYIHDLARTHDDACAIHGTNSAVHKFPLYKKLFIKNGATEEDLIAIKLAVSNHSQRFEIDKSNPYYKAVALLRDADGLDLVRLDREIDPNILRYNESVSYISNAQDLFEDTDHENYTNFNIFFQKNMRYYI